MGHTAVRKLRRTVVAAGLGVVGVAVVRAGAPKLRALLTARCEAMFEQMPDAFPPKKMMRGIEQTRLQTARIVELLEAGKETAPETADRVEHVLVDAAHHDRRPHSQREQKSR